MTFFKIRSSALFLPSNVNGNRGPQRIVFAFALKRR
jgi:hypothetical protein